VNHSKLFQHSKAKSTKFFLFTTLPKKRTHIRIWEESALSTKTLTDEKLLHSLATEQAQLKSFREARFGDLRPLTSSLEEELHTYSTFQRCVNATSEL